MSEKVENASESERELFWRAFSDGYERLANDPAAWAEIETEREADAPSLRDGLD